ncbi:LysR family transcriptional regulator ArgP [Acinetobacter sp. 194]|uniref:LysR family transcriptional regulator ArgP n=1 Tax=Acinetobacter shaoyimingii TaxID=2715164 RepID=UPI0014097A1B|nr:LysR family transcriptional regulator ArgP [Acinetobacter shaoyimingii]NHB58219.1 LysR family transcriptional regulator ArgP [Acinetobacter shaoyimingii]
MLQSKHSEAFLAVAETGSFDSAAERLHITASAVTLRVQALEKKLGHLLIIRERPCRVTQAGQQLLAHLQQTKVLEQNLLEKLMGKSATSQFYTLNIATNADSLATWLLSTLQPTLISENIVIQLKVADQTQTHHLLEAGLVNACISTEQESIKGCEVKPIGTMRYHMVASPQFIERYFAHGFNRESLRYAPAVIFNEQDQMHHEVIYNAYGLNMSQYPHHLIPASNAFLESIVLGLGFGMVPEFQIKEYIKQGQLIEIMPEAQTDVMLYWHHWKKQSHQLEQLTSQIIEHAPFRMNQSLNEDTD